MSLFNRAIRPPPTLSDEAIERYLAALHAACEPDPLFRRRLRSDAVNQFVAAREGITRPLRAGIRRRQMGRVGRATLYASFSLGMSAASVLAASQEALPGEALYGLKQRIEELRWDVVPAHLHGDLAAYALGERIEEMVRLAEAGNLELAIAMAPTIDRDYERVVALGQTDDAARADRIARHLAVLEGLLDKLPANAQAAVQNVIDGTPGLGQGAGAGPNPGAGGPAPAIGAGSGSEPGATAKPEPTPKPEPAKPEPTPSPAPTPRPERPEQPPRGQPSSQSDPSD